MSFSLEDIADEFLSVAGKGREWLDAGGYSFRRPGKVDNVDLRQLAKTLWMKRWRETNPERVRDYYRASYAALKADPERWASWLAYASKAHRRRRKNPVWLAKWRERARRRGRLYYARLKSDPVRRAKYEAMLQLYRRRGRERYQRIKADPEKLAKYRADNARRARKYAADPAKREKRLARRREQQRERRRRTRRGGAP
jgi:hypothetical protein